MFDFLLIYFRIFWQLTKRLFLQNIFTLFQYFVTNITFKTGGKIILKKKLSCNFLTFKGLNLTAGNYTKYCLKFAAEMPHSFIFAIITYT
ncbi:hypothetical protein HYN49_13025 [Flavobacterium pallidum]|uniref:Uncharacterized protein n=1 Tax=Flavobacterium pallidum TaxID=2172098 RepID=A0A2S1SK39_9FLAO|nr:hypothetical protein HYN49_13025 [Flavobacterium pallidum]